MTPEQIRQERIAHFDRLMRFERASRCFAAPGDGTVGSQPVGPPWSPAEVVRRLVAWGVTG